MQISGHFSCDNSYSVWKGNISQVDPQPLLQATNSTAAAIFQGEDLPAFVPSAGGYLYIACWSDDEGFQGLIGSFTGIATIHTGDSRWRVLATGINKGNSQFPTSAEINTAISAAQPTDWKVPAVGAPNGGAPWGRAVAGISDQARWIWHDSGRDTRARFPNAPYVPFAGFNHQEFLIFRIPCEEFTPVMDKPEKPCCVVNVCQCCDGEKTSPPPPAPVIVKEKCSDCGACVFEVRLQRIRYVSGKPGWLDGAAELSFTIHVDGNMFNFPTGNGSYLRVLKRGGQFPTDWIPINARAGIIEVPCNGERAFDLMTEMVENPAKEKGLSAAFEGGRPWGSSEPSTPILKCGSKPAPVLQVVQLMHGGNSREDMKMEVEYRFSQVTACSCR